MPGDILEKAQLAEQEGELEKAAELYEEEIKNGKADDVPFDRLMIIYRKLKMPKDELRVIKTGIKRFEDHYKSFQKSTGKKISELSNSFMKSSGLKDKKGKPTYQPQPIARWVKRQHIVEKKMK